MKRILISFILSICLIATYFTFSAYFSTVFFDEDEVVRARFLFPLYLPFVVADFVIPQDVEDSLPLALFIGLIGNAIVYWAPVYALLYLLNLFGKSKKISEDNPPSPPSFDA